jgi:hypothetical protein
MVGLFFAGVSRKDAKRAKAAKGVSRKDAK